MEIVLHIKFDLLSMFFQKKGITIPEIERRSGISNQAIHNFKNKSFTDSEKKTTYRITGFILQKVAEALNVEAGLLFQELIDFENKILWTLSCLEENVHAFVDCTETEFDELLKALVNQQEFPDLTWKFFKEYMSEYVKAYQQLLEAGLFLAGEDEME